MRFEHFISTLAPIKTCASLHKMKEILNDQPFANASLKPIASRQMAAENSGTKETDPPVALLDSAMMMEVMVPVKVEDTSPNDANIPRPTPSEVGSDTTRKHKRRSGNSVDL